MTPKSLLRHPKVASGLAELEAGSFQRILADPEVPPPAVRRVLLCSGKVYYDLLAAREARKRADVAIVRLEQLYPLSAEQLREALEPYPATTPVFWVQEEPANMGAWPSMLARFGGSRPGQMTLTGVCRPASASPATGWAVLHKLEQTKLLDEAFEAHGD
jgi:2-oxoglutarate dehydrogenase complex dehydrogenase (E1) component-like enzyme